MTSGTAGASDLPARRLVLLSSSERGVVRAEEGGGGWRVQQALEGKDVRCLSGDPLHPDVAYAGTQGEGLFRSDDRGRSWRPLGPPGVTVKAVAPSPHEPGLVWVGLKPARVVACREDGRRWEPLAPFRRSRSWFWMTPAESPMTQPYVQGLAESPTQPGFLAAGIEAGALVVSEDGGGSWSGHRRGASRDCHTLSFHPHDGSWAYEGGGTGAAVSRDGGRSWRKARAGLDRRYCWAVAADPEEPTLWYVSAAPGARKAHGPGPAEARIFRSGPRGWEALAGGLPDPLPSMPYGLSAPAPGEVYALLASGDVWRSLDRGTTWSRLPVALGKNTRAFALLPGE